MRFLLALSLSVAVSAAALAQAAPPPAAPAKAAAKKAAPAKAAAKAPAKAAAAKAPAPKPEEKAAAPAEAKPAEAAAEKPAAPAPAPAPAPAIDPEEFRQKVMEEVRRELAKTREEVKQETGWIEQDSVARVQDSEAVERLKSRVNLFQAHGYLRTRFEFFSGFDLGRGNDPAGYTTFPTPFINSANNHSQSGANFRFRFDPVLEVSEDLSIHATFDVLDNVVLGSNLRADPMLDPYTPIAALTTTRAGSAVNVKRAWGRVNTQLGELVIGRMGHHWGLGILHNDGNGLDQDFGDTYDRVAFSPREFRGHKLTVRMDLLDKGSTTTGEHGELGRSVDIDTLDDGYSWGFQIARLDTADDLRKKLDAGEFVFNYGVSFDYRLQDWDTPGGVVTKYGAASGPGTLGDFAAERNAVVQRKARIYTPSLFASFKARRVRIEAELAGKMGSIGTRALRYADIEGATADPNLAQQLTLFQMGGVLQSEFAFLPADALLLGLEFGAATGDSGAYGFGARPWRSGSGNPQGTAQDGTVFRNAGAGDIDGAHYDFNTNDPAHTRGRVNNFLFNRAYSVDMILFKNIISAVTSAWYLKPSIRYRPTGRKSGGGDDTGFEIAGALIYSQAWYAENTPSTENKPLGLEANVGITYDTSDKLRAGFQYGLLVPLAGFKNIGIGPNGTVVQARDTSIAHAFRATLAIPF